MKDINKKFEGKIEQRQGQINVASRNPKNVKTSISTKCIIRSEKQICSTSKHSR